MEVPRLGVQLDLQPPAYTTVAATSDPSHVCKLHHSSRQCQILNPLSEARDRTFHLTLPSWIHFCCTTTGTPYSLFLKLLHRSVSSTTKPAQTTLLWTTLDVYRGLGFFHPSNPSPPSSQSDFHLHDYPPHFHSRNLLHLCSKIQKLIRSLTASPIPNFLLSSPLLSLVLLLHLPCSHQFLKSKKLGKKTKTDKERESSEKDR